MSQWGTKARGVYAEFKDWLQVMLQHAQELAQKELQESRRATRVKTGAAAEPGQNTLARLRRLRAATAQAERNVPPTRRARVELGQLSKAELYRQAQQMGIVGRSRMKKDELRRAIEEKR